MMLRKPLYSILLGLALGVSGFFLGWLVAPRGGEEAAPVRIQASSVDGTSQLRTIPLDAAQQGFQHLTYYGVQDVTVTLAGRTIPLEQALSEQRLTLDALIAQVRQDARQGICQEDSRSDQGLTRFVYRYPDFDLLHIHDLYETPKGKQEQIVSPLDSSDPLPEPAMLNMGGETTLTVPLSQVYGPLTPGEYLLYFKIQDIYNKEDLRPLQRNYRDIQVYPVSFRIPE